MTSLHDDLRQIPELFACGEALALFAEQLGSVTFIQEGERWVARPHNFVTFKVQSSRNRDLVITLRGNPVEYESLAELQLKPDRPGHSRFNFSSASQLQAAATHIKRAYHLFSRGSGREALRPVTREDVA